MILSEIFNFPCNEETISAAIDWNANRDKPTVLCVHGGGTAVKGRKAYVTEHLAAQGHSAIRFDHSGHGDSTGILNEGSLQKRVEQALAASQFMDTSQPITVIATSMGGHVALELLKHLPVKTLILFCPAAYAAEAYALRFDGGFTDILRQPESYLRATVFDDLQNFTGNFLHVIGEHDTVIPPGVTALYQQHSVNAAQREFMVMPGWPHNMHNLFQENETERQQLLQKIGALV